MKILLAEDEPVQQRLIRVLLERWGYSCVLANDGLEASRILASDEAPRIALVDWLMPGMDGLEVVAQLRLARREPYTYVIMLTSRASQKDVIAGLDAGADDYMTKPVHPTELRLRLHAARRIIELQSQLIAAREELRVQATHDPLTGLLNRGAVMGALAREVRRAQRDGYALGVAMLDLDHFKAVNDTYGHRVGDRVLEMSAERLVGALRAQDLVGRYGGEEFLVLLPRCPEQGVERLGERLCEVIRSSPMAMGSVSLPQTISVGLVLLPAGARIEHEQMLQLADEALYRAKENGRNRLEFERIGILPR